MSLLEHATMAAPRMELQKKEMAATIQHEIGEAKRIQEQTGCSWTEALKMAKLTG